MTNQLFIEIDKFDKWAQSEFDMPQDDIGGEWECNYDNWGFIYKSFEEFINTADPNKLTSNEKDRLLYILARDNEMENLSRILGEQFLIILAEHSISYGHRDDKWQLAVQLYKLTDKKKALSLLDKFVNDEEEYVNRRSLMELAKLKSDTVEYYAERFWHKDKYAEIEEYQKIAVLHSLNTIKSKLLDDYIKLAKKSGLKYLMQNANKIETEKNCL